MGNDFLGHVAYVLVATGMAFLARQNALGWVFRFSGEAIWVGVGLRMDMSSIWTWGIVFMVIDIIGFRAWRQERRTGWESNSEL